eukprot:3346396-Pyramimonas_sp.AAC.1
MSSATTDTAKAIHELGVASRGHAQSVAHDGAAKPALESEVALGRVDGESSSMRAPSRAGDGVDGASPSLHGPPVGRRQPEGGAGSTEGARVKRTRRRGKQKETFCE